MNKIITFGIAGILIFTGILYSWMCPIMKQLPQPSGAFAVGKRTYHIVDQKHKDERQPSGQEECMVQLYYPNAIKKQDASKYPYEAQKLDAYKKMKARGSNIPSFLWNCLLNGITSYAEPDAPVASESAPFPVILFLPGIGSLSLYSGLLQEIASHGYVVVEIEPPFDVELVLFPEQRGVELDPVLAKAMVTSDRTAIYAYRAQAHARWLRYLSLTLDRLTTMNKDSTSPFYKKLDLDRLAILGHSHGGGVAIDFCAHNDLCKAGIDMDGWTKTANTDEPFSKPFLFLMNEKGLDEITKLAASMPENAKKIEIPHAGHGAFSDLIFLKQPLAWYMGVATANPERVRQEIISQILAFFDRTLKKR